MLKEIADNLYILEMPMPETRVRSIDHIRTVIVRGPERDLIIDAGINAKTNLEMVLDAYRELGISAEITDVFCSHLHPDHCGLAWKMQTRGAGAFAHAGEAKLIHALNKKSYWEYLHLVYQSEGLPMDFEEFYASHPVADHFPEPGVQFTELQDGDVLNVGAYRFECIVTPGHSPFHTCLYDAEKKLMIGGDSVLSDVAPILFVEPDFDDPLGEYLKGLNRLEALEIETFIAAHGALNFDLKERIEDLRLHYRQKCRRILELLQDVGPISAWDLSRITIKDEIPKELEHLSPVSRWFFFLPTLACLRYLEKQGEIRAEWDDEVRKYC